MGMMQKPQSSAERALASSGSDQADTMAGQPSISGLVGAGGFAPAAFRQDTQMQGLGDMGAASGLSGFGGQGGLAPNPLMQAGGVSSIVKALMGSRQ